ncbi:hypothetical protein N7495_004395 [Penicillium taxi]|uniref:uncharacterized protein n=1 Tax=Penicillium taxi TaxID=168475 RepID=UPI0025456B32|nr:uncharacterized protein N7495_004395 [Penicillium taxi]KAJ5899651.1 hypothetical protein N7495_004395 [Penicillium taxi]
MWYILTLLIQNCFLLIFFPIWTLGSPINTLSDESSLTVTSVSVTPLFLANFPENTHTSTIGRNGEATPVPVLGGSECWFCPDNESGNTIGGWALLGINGPGKFQPTIPTNFIDPIPVITVSANGDPTYTPSSETHDLATEVKRELPNPEVKYDVVKDLRYQKLEKAYNKYRSSNPKLKEWDWKDGGSYAVRVSK